MLTKERNEISNVSLIDAVEALSQIADLNLDQEVGIIQPHQLVVQDKKVTYRTVHWLHRHDPGETIDIVKDIFKTILNYLRRFYREDYSLVGNTQTMEGVKTIMVLVGEAAKRLDKYTALFEKTKMKSVTELKEYKQLQEFYLTRIARKIDEGTLGKWLLALTKKAWMQRKIVEVPPANHTYQSKHVFVDLDSVKKDTEYELFFLRKEDGSRFYSPRLIRNIKLVCDFGDYFKNSKRAEDPLEDIVIWQDRCYMHAAKEIIQSMGNRLNRYFYESAKFKDRELVDLLNKSIMALMLCGNSSNLLKNVGMKSCKDYFADFQHYLREALQSDDYNKLLAYPPKSSSKLANCLVDTVQGLCMAIFEHINLYQAMGSFIQHLIAKARETQSQDHEKAVKASHQLWNGLASDHAAMAKILRGHVNGPLVKVLNVLQDGGRFAFDPIGMHSIPSQVFSLGVHDAKIINIGMSSPTIQEFIHKVSVIDEFKAFLRDCQKDHLIGRHLIINLQDRTSWREHFRCIAIEELQKQEDFQKHLTVVTLAKDTEFYHQLAPYHQDNHADVFISHLKEHLQDDSSGYYFPEVIKKALFPTFVDGVIEEIHRIFFSNKNILLRENRMDFIEIFYLFLQLKLIELVRPDSFSMICKDGVDMGPCASAEMFAFLKLIQKDSVGDADKAFLNHIFYAPSIFIRERMIQHDRFNRVMSTLKCIESIRDQLGPDHFVKIIKNTFGHFYKKPILEAKLLTK
jgi:hypothetical protein